MKILLFNLPLSDINKLCRQRSSCPYNLMSLLQTFQIAVCTRTDGSSIRQRTPVAQEEPGSSLILESGPPDLEFKSEVQFQTELFLMHKTLC